MSTHDTSGRPWATVADTKVGDQLIPDSGFDCLAVGVYYTVCADHTGRLYVQCDMAPSHRQPGCHYLDGQLNDQGTHYVGLYKGLPKP